MFEDSRAFHTGSVYDIVCGDTGRRCLSTPVWMVDENVLVDGKRRDDGRETNGRLFPKLPGQHCTVQYKLHLAVRR